MGEPKATSLETLFSSFFGDFIRLPWVGSLYTKQEKGNCDGNHIMSMYQLLSLDTNRQRTMMCIPLPQTRKYHEKGMNLPSQFFGKKQSSSAFQHFSVQFFSWFSECVFSLRLPAQPKYFGCSSSYRYTDGQRMVSLAWSSILEES